MDFHMDFWSYWMCFINVLFKVITILNFTNAVLSKMTFRSIFESFDDVLCGKEIHRLGPMDLKIYSLDRNTRLRLDSWQSLETFTKIISVTSILSFLLTLILLHAGTRYRYSFDANFLSNNLGKNQVWMKTNYYRKIYLEFVFFDWNLGTFLTEKYSWVRIFKL